MKISNVHFCLLRGFIVFIMLIMTAFIVACGLSTPQNIRNPLSPTISEYRRITIISVTADNNFTKTPQPFRTPTISELLPSPTPGYGLCPIDMTLPSVYILSEYSQDHLGLDIGGPYGTVHQSPDECTVVELYTGNGEQEGQQGLIMECAGLEFLGAKRISLGHVDFSYNDYDTLRFYGIPIETFFEETGNVKSGVLGIAPNTNSKLHRGDDLHLYLACSGYCNNNHTHITIWIKSDTGFDPHMDPQQILICK